jgi:ribonuclease HI
MVIEARHFDTRLNQWIHTDNNPDNPDSLLKEELKNSLLEHFLPGVNFSFGHMDEKATDTQLKNHPEGHKLLLSSKSRLLYGPEESLETISKLCPDNKDRGAYGSIFLGSCKNAISGELNILIVDDTTGENGGIINNNQAYRLVGDCYGQISTELYHQLTGHQEGDQYRVIQHRFGWTDKDRNDDKFRFGKGTVRPANLDQILNYQEPNQPKIDLVIPLSAFKGTDKDNPSGPTKPQIKPGLYRQNMWLGEKSQSELGKTAISQMIASFPSGLKDFGEQVELEAAKLKEALDDPRKIAQLYCEKYEKRKAFLEQQAAELEEEAAVDPEVREELETLRERVATDTSIYKLIKTDLEGSGQLLETEKIQRELARFVQGEWQDISVGKTLTFERAMVIPSKDLQNGEICIPHYQDGEEVLNFRSPFLNSNGLCVSTNKVVDDVLGPNGKPLAGVIAVSDETSDRIYNRLNEQIKSILPEAQGKNIPLEGIENYLDQNIDKLETKDKIEFSKKFNQYISELQSGGYELEILPQESEQERQARDYDGDCIGFDHASKYPNLTAEASWRNLPENAYDPTVKLKKQSFYREDGSQPEFEEIAIHMSDGISVGTINNHLTSIEALESEVTILKIFGSEKDQVGYVLQVAKHYEDLFKTEAWAKSKGIEGKEVPEKYRSYIEEFVQAAGQEPQNQANALKAMNINTRMYREMIAEAAFQNQIAVDLFKSAKKPDMEIIRNNSGILHREVNYIKDKKKDVYVENTIQPTGYSPVEILISKTNQYFEKARLESRELAQFSNLFKEVEFTHDQRLQATLAKKEFDKEFNNATRYTQRKKVEKGPSATVDIGGGKKLDITNLLKSDHPLVWNAQKITLKLSEIAPEKRSKDKPHKYRVVAQINDETENGKPKFRTLGTVSKEQENSLEELGIVPDQEITSTKIFFQPELSEGQIKLMYLHAYQIAENFYNSIPEDQKLAMAAASWAVSTTREGSNSKNQNQVEQEVERQKKVSNFVYASFSQEIIKQVETLQFTDFTLTGHDRTSQIIKLENQVFPQEVRFNISEHKDSKGNTVLRDVIEVKIPETGEYETFANINATDGKLPIGTTATGRIERGEVYTATITTKIPGLPQLNFQVKELQKFQCKDQTFSGEQVNLTIIKDKLEREDYVITFKNGNKEEKLGTLSKESIKVGIEQGWLAEKPGQSGQKLQLEITSIATGENAFAIGKTSNGNLVRIDINDKLKNREFKGQEISVTIKAYDKQDVYTAKIGNLSLGIIGQYTEKAFGNRSRYGQNKSTVQQLVNAGIINENKVQTTIPVIITSNETTCKLSIDPESVQYPETWVKRYQLVDQQKEVSLVEQKNNQLFDKITERPTIIFQSQEDKLVGLVGLTVDSKKAEFTKKYLDQVGITYDQVSKSQSRLEAKKGMTVFMLDESTISPERKEQFIERFSGIKSNDAPPLPAQIIPEQTVYFNNPNQQYTLEDNSQVIKESIGLVVPAQDAIAVNDWLEFQDKNNNYIIDKDSNIAIFIIENNTDIGELQKDLTNLLGEAINIGEVDGFDQYEQLSNKLNQRVKEQGSLLKINSTLQPSEYKQALQSLPNRPKELGREEISVPMTPAKPIQEKNTANTKLSILSKQISPIIKNFVQVNSPTGNITQVVELSKLGNFDEAISTLNDQEIEWIAKKLNSDIPDRNSQDNWFAFTENAAEEITILEAATQEYLSPISENIKDIISLENKANAENNQSFLDEVTTRKQAEVEKYGQEIYNELETKARLALKPEQSPKNLPEAVISIGSVAPRTTSSGIATAVITKHNQQVQLTQILAKLETTTVQTAYSGDSDRAEYQSLINGLTEASSTGYKSIRIESSNNKFLENFQADCPRQDLKPLHEQAKTLLQKFNKHELSWQHSQINPAYQLARTTAHKLATTQLGGTQQPQLSASNPPTQNHPGNTTTAISLPNSREADQTKAIEIIGKVSSEKVEQLRSHLETHVIAVLETDKSNYAPGRQVAWVGAKWDLKDKDFKPGVQDDKLMELVKQVYPDADIVLVTYSENPGAGINYHRDDSYTATEARSINIGNSDWGYRAAKERMAWTKEENKDAPYQEFKLESGTVTRFNCKNEHAALNTEAGRWSINIWSIKNDLGRENSVRQKFENFLASNQPPRAVVQSNSDLTIKINEWTPGGEIKVERSYTSLKEATRNTPSHPSNQPTVEEIITIGNSTAARAANPQIPDNPTISGKPVPMIYSLHMHGEPDKVPVDTTIDAMRGHGRIHTTRGVDYQKTYGIKEGDIAIAYGGASLRDATRTPIAVGGKGEKVAFRVGRQYEITPQLIQNPAYQQAWAKWEKHSHKELTQTQASKSKLYGLFMEPLGDYANGKIVPFPPVQKQTPTSVNISPDSKDGLGAALSLATALAKQEGKLQNDYQVSVNNNPEAADGQYGSENHTAKVEGAAYKSAEHAFHHQKQLNPSADDYQIMVSVLQAKLKQHPRLTNEITKRGGVEWLENCTAVATTGGTPATHCLTNVTNAQDQQWEGKGKESAFIRALTEAYTNVVEKNNETDIAPISETAAKNNPLANLQPINPAVAEHMKKDIAMAEIATQFIGKSAAPLEIPSSTRNYEQAWGDRANTGNYSASDVIMVSGSGSWRGVTNEQIKQTFEKEYVPLLNAAIEAKSSFVVGNAKGTDQLVQNYLTERGYQVKLSNVGAAFRREGYAKLYFTENIKDTNEASTSPENTTTTSEIPSDAVTQQKTSKSTKNQTSLINTKPEQTDTGKTNSTENLLTQVPQFAPGINLNSRSPDPLGAVLTSTTVKSKEVGAIVNDYPVSFRDNQEMPAGIYGPETYTKSKPAGQPFLSVEQAFYAYKETVPLKEPRVQLMAEILQARFEQHPKLMEAVTERGGAEWLKQCSYLVSNKEKNFWEGKGLQSPYIRALTQGYTKALENSNSRATENQTASIIQPTPSQEPLPEPQTRFSATTFPKNPRSISTDIQQALSQTQTNSQTNSLDKTLDNIKQSTVQNLQNWYEAAQKLGRSEKYLNRIQEVTAQYINDSSYSLENAFKAMSRDVNQLQQINEMTKLAQSVVKVLGKEDINGIMSIKTESYKNYQIATKAQEETYVIKDKDNNVLLYLREGKIKVNKLNQEVVDDFRFMNFRIEHSLQNIRRELVER